MPKWKQKWKIDLVLSSETVTKFQSPVRGELKKKNPNSITLGCAHLKKKYYLCKKIVVLVLFTKLKPAFCETPDKKHLLKWELTLNKN